MSGKLGVGRGRSRLCRRYSRRLIIAMPCYITPPCLTPNYRVISAMVRRSYRGCVRVERRESRRHSRVRPRPTLLTDLSFGVMTDRREVLPFYRGGLRHDRRRRCRCSAGGRGQFVISRKNCVCRDFVRPADFFANCPLLVRNNAVFAPLVDGRFVRPTNFVCRFAFCFHD